MPRAPLSLKGHALSLLARREYSRQELRSRLLAQARKLAQWTSTHPANASVDSMQAFLQGESAPAEPPDPATLATEVDRVLDWLAQQRHQSDTRFVESRVHARASRFGHSRIKQELSRHGLSLDADAAQALRDTEFSRAREVWQRKFGQPADDAAGRAKQARFLAARGFTADVVWRVVGGRDED